MEVQRKTDPNKEGQSQWSWTCCGQATGNRLQAEVPAPSLGAQVQVAGPW